MGTASRSLQSSQGALCARYDCAMLDLDGVVYRGTQPIDGVPDVLRRARAAGMSVAFVTNNASRSADAVAGRLRDLGIDAAADDVVTSAQAAAREVAKLVPAGAAVLVVGGDGLESAVRERGLDPVRTAADRPKAVVQGFSPDIGWRALAEAAYAVAGGVPWVASNLDRTIPTDSGIGPGNGTLVDAVAAAVGHRPDVVAGKPHRPLFDETVRRVDARRPLVVGDRLDTDIEGAGNVGADSLLVMTGVTDLGALCSASSLRRPSYVAWTLDGLLGDHCPPRQRDRWWQLGEWSVAVHDGAVVVDRAGDDRDEGLRAVTAAAWDWYDATADASRVLDLGSALDAFGVRQ